MVSISQTLDNPGSTVCIDFLSITLLNLLQSFHILSHKYPTVIWQLLFFLNFFFFGMQEDLFFVKGVLIKDEAEKLCSSMLAEPPLNLAGLSYSSP